MTGRLFVLALVLIAGCGSGSGSGGASPAPDRSPAAAAQRFLDSYMDGDGRVVRRDQGGDTVSEGQAYAMLLAVALRDEHRFDQAWAWAERHLRRRDGLLAWHWRAGAVTDRQPAADADLDAGRALVLAARAFDRPDLRADAERLAAGIRASMLVDGRVVAGPWAARDAVVNPSYTAPRALQALGLRTIRRALTDLRAFAGLPPDWARVAGRRLRATGPPAGGEPVYGYDAARLPVRLAEACRPRARRLAAGLWPLLRQHSAALPRQLDGTPAGGGRHPVALVAAAAAADAAGDARSRDRLLDAAQDLEAATPTYYGAAWVALGRMMLQTQRLGACR